MIIVTPILLAGVIMTEIFIVYGLNKINQKIDDVQKDISEDLNKERRERQGCDNNIMLKLHERYDALVRWMGRMNKTNRYTNNKKQDNGKDQREQRGEGRASHSHDRQA